MHWGVACITARADVYAMMMGSLIDDEERHCPQCIDEANVQPVLKYSIPNHIMCNPPALLLLPRGQIPTSYVF